MKPHSSSNGTSTTKILHVVDLPDSPETNNDPDGPAGVIVLKKEEVDTSQRPTEINRDYPVSKACDISAQLSAQTDFSKKGTLADQVSLFAQLGISYTWVKRKK